MKVYKKKTNKNKTKNKTKQKQKQTKKQRSERCLFFLTTLSHVRFGFWGEGELHPKIENVLYAISKNQHFTGGNGVNISKQIVCETKKIILKF